MSKLYVKSRSRFRNLQTATAITLPFPIHPEIRLAQLGDSAPQFGAFKAFRPDSLTHLEGYKPNILVGTGQELQQVAEQSDLGTVNLSCVDHAIVALTQCGNAPLSDVERVVLWQTFGVPVFEIFIGLDNSIFGYECELHEGWHLASAVHLTETDGDWTLDADGITGLRTGLSGFVANDICPCGRNGPRFLNVQLAKKSMGRLDRDEFLKAIA